MPLKPSPGLWLLLLIVAIPLFGHLDEMPLFQWDEARLANNALEMLHNHKWFVSYYGDSPDMWSTKPPLMIWAQVAMMKLVGVGELAVRLPSALAGLGTCLMLFTFFAKKYKEPLLGLFCAVVLITSTGYISDHGTRNGDFDALLTMFTTGYCLSFFLFLEEGRRKFLYVTFGFIILATLTKGVQALLFMPALLVYSLYKRKFIRVLMTPGLYVGIAVAAAVVGGYYLLREHFNEGYIIAVLNNELGGRYNHVVEGHQGSPWSYVRILTGDYFHEWYVFVIPGLLVGFFGSRKWLRDMSFFAGTLVFCYMVVISNSETQLPWYVTPLYPMLAILCGVFIFNCYVVLCNSEWLKQCISVNMLPVLFLVIVFWRPYSLILDRALASKGDTSQSQEERDFGVFLRQYLHNDRDRNVQYYILNGSSQQNFFWYYQVLAYQGRPLVLVVEADLKPGMNIIPYGDKAVNYLATNFRAKCLRRYPTEMISEIIDRKE